MLWLWPLSYCSHVVNVFIVIITNHIILCLFYRHFYFIVAIINYVPLRGLTISYGIISSVLLMFVTNRIYVVI